MERRALFVLAGSLFLLGVAAGQNPGVNNAELSGHNAFMLRGFRAAKR